MKTILLYATILFLLLSIIYGCVAGIKNTYDKDGIKTDGGPYMAFGQMQTEEGYNVIYVNKGVGWDSEIPVPFSNGFSVLKVAFGYLNSTRMLLDKGTVLVLDVSIDPFNKGIGVTDTLLYGREAVRGYKDFLVLPEEGTNNTDGGGQ